MSKTKLHHSDYLLKSLQKRTIPFADFLKAQSELFQNHLNINENKIEYINNDFNINIKNKFKDININIIYFFYIILIYYKLYILYINKFF